MKITFKNGTEIEISESESDRSPWSPADAEGLHSYRPWLALGMDELEYWKTRYIEARKDLKRYEYGQR